MTFSVSEYQQDGSVRGVRYTLAGSTAEGWEILRDGAFHLRLGPGYRLLQVSHCGVCTTDLARRHLPFPLPQVTGHEVVGLAAGGAPVAVEINASHVARGLAVTDCVHCAVGLDHHCPTRRVLGIHDLPGGFAPWLLAPVHGVVPLPPTIPPLTATLIEPFAAALHAVDSVELRDGDRAAVLGPRRLGTLVIAALAARRAQTGRRFEIVAIVRRPELGVLARDLGADEVLLADQVLSGASGDTPRVRAAVVFDTTGAPEGLALAAHLATREVHVKSTSGRKSTSGHGALGLVNPTAAVVDELTLVGVDGSGAGIDGRAGEVAALLGTDLPDGIRRRLERRGMRVVVGEDAGELAARLAADSRIPLGAADIVVVTSVAALNAAIRPRAGVERALVRPRGTIAVADVGQARVDILEPLLTRRLRVGTSRCGDFRAALALLDADGGHLRRRLGTRMVTDVLPPERLADALARAAGPGSVKVVVAHAEGLLGGRRVLSGAPGEHVPHPGATGREHEG